MRIVETGIPGCREIFVHRFSDERGKLTKIFHHDLFEEHDLETCFMEQYYTYSVENVLRGLHFQIPPKAQSKLVTCVSGKVLDAVVDLRKGSPTYGKHALIELSADQGNMLFVPQGLAHGYYVISESAIVLYNGTSVYSPEHDAGIHWNSAGIHWPAQSPIVSLKDSGFSGLSDFSTPFSYGDG